MKTLLALLLLFPLSGASFLAIFGRRLPRRLVEAAACAAIAASFIVALAAFLHAERSTYTVTFFDWFTVGDLRAAADAFYDPLAAIMAVMVTFVSGIIHIYSVGFMREEEGYVRYFAYLNFFVFSMLVITLGDSLIFVFLGWEGVGFCSYALIGFWYRDVRNAMAGRKAFLLTRIGDVAFGIAIALCFAVFSNLSISHITTHTGQMTAQTATILGLLLLWSAVGKSAQLPLSVWLPDAMAGPSPVSALIHAATMVTAGVYLLMRFFPVLELSPTALLVIASVAAFTAFYAACSALAQNDIKRVLAYSTISQVGYMFLGVGAGDLAGSMHHLLTHAFFKSLLFLAAGCIIQALHEEHNIFRMGAEVRRRLPSVFILFLAGILALGAIPPASGYFSKDRILMALFNHPGMAYKVLWAVATATAFLTALYAFRLFFLVFTGEPVEARSEGEVHPLPRLMTITLWPLAFFALFAGFLNVSGPWFLGEWLTEYLSAGSGTLDTIAGSLPGASGAHGSSHLALSVGDIVLSLSAVVLAYFIYGPGKVRGRRATAVGRPGIHDLLFSGFYLDRVYEAVVGRPYRELSRFLWVDVDEGGVDRMLVGSGEMLPFIATGLRLWTTGRLSTYLRSLLLGFAIILCILALSLYQF